MTRTSVLQPRRIASYAATCAALAAVYYVSAKLGLQLATVHVSATPVWPPTGIALAAFLVLGCRVWPGALLGAFLANLTTAGSVATCLGIAAGNTLEGVVGALLVNRFAGGRSAMSSATNIVKFSLLSAGLSTMVSATCGVTILALGGGAEWGQYWDIWVTWWLGDGAGALMVAPLLLAWAAAPWPRWRLARAGEAALMMASVVLVGVVIFWETLPLAYLCVPVLLWPAFRFGQREAATAFFVLCGIAIWGTTHGRGPLVGDTANGSLLLLQAFLGITAVITLALAALVSERQDAQARLRAAHAELEALVDRRTVELTRANADLRQEIAQRKQAEQRFRTFVEAAPDAMVIVDERDRIVLVNSQTERIFGYRREELVGQGAENLVPLWPQTRHASGHGGAGRNGSDLELSALRKDGTAFPVEISLSPLAIEGASLVTTAIRDISARKRVEQSLRRANEDLHQARERALQAERLAAIGQMSAGLAHESRNALQTIQASVERLARRIRDEPEVRFIAEIQKAEERLLRLFEDVRGYAAPVNLECRVHNLAILWREAWAQTRPMRQREVRLEERSEVVNLDCFVDQFCIERVFHNILLNAVAACHEPGRIQIHASETLLDGQPAVCVAIRDNGPGLTAEQCSRAFEPFYTTKTRGTGLGMAISRRIVEAHGGRITAGNAATQGAEIQVALPRGTR